MRGKVKDVHFSSSPLRITPAYAGKRVGLRSGCLRDQDHPRLCGEKLVYTQSEHLSRGSPPPMRGKDISAALVMLLWGITPAYAGKSKWQRGSPRTDKDHPRLCGEKSQHFGVTTDYLGSPPPMRGKVRSIHWKNTS